MPQFAGLLLAVLVGAQSAVAIPVCGDGICAGPPFETPQQCPADCGTIPCPAPSAEQVVFYGGTNYSGTCVTKGLGTYPGPTQMSLANDALSSVKVGANAQVVVCKDANYSGNWQLLIGNVSNMATTSVGDEATSSAVVMKQTKVTLPATLFSDDGSIG